MNNFTEKNNRYECNICKSVVKRSSRSGHLRTTKHINALNGVETEYKYDSATRAIFRQNYQAHVKSKRGLDEKGFKEKEKKRKQVYRAKIKKAKMEAQEKAEQVEQSEEAKKAEPTFQKAEPTFQKAEDKPEKKQTEKTALVQTSRKPKKYKKDICKSTFNSFKNSLTIADKSASHYLDQLKSLYKKIHSKPWDCITDGWIRNAQGVINFVENKDLFKGKAVSDNTKKARYEALVSYIKIKHMNENEGWKVAQYQYHRAMIKYRDISEDKRKDNSLSDKQQLSYIAYPELLKMFIQKYKTLPIQTRVICGLYLLLPTRRNEAYEQMTISTNINEKRKGNFLIVSGLRGRNRTPIKIILNHFKTRSTYGKQIIDLQSPLLIRKVGFNYPRKLLIQILTEYIKTKNISDNQFLLSPNKTFDKPYNESNFNRIIVDSFHRLTGNDSIGSTLLRRVYSTQLSTENLSINQHTKIAELMGHSYQENLKYRIV